MPTGMQTHTGHDILQFSFSLPTVVLGSLLRAIPWRVITGDKNDVIFWICRKKRPHMTTRGTTWTWQSSSLFIIPCDIWRSLEGWPLQYLQWRLEIELLCTILCQAPDSLWCLFLWIILPGGHPYGDRWTCWSFICHSYNSDQGSNVLDHQDTLAMALCIWI